MKTFSTLFVIAALAIGCEGAGDVRYDLPEAFRDLQAGEDAPETLDALQGPETDVSEDALDEDLVPDVQTDDLQTDEDLRPDPGRDLGWEWNVCHDGTSNYDESDVDCGGPICESCGDGRRCLYETDCEPERTCEYRSESRAWVCIPPVDDRAD